MTLLHQHWTDFYRSGGGDVSVEEQHLKAEVHALKHIVLAREQALEVHLWNRKLPPVSAGVASTFKSRIKMHRLREGR